MNITPQERTALLLMRQRHTEAIAQIDTWLDTKKPEKPVDPEVAALLELDRVADSLVDQFLRHTNVRLEQRVVKNWVRTYGKDEVVAAANKCVKKYKTEKMSHSHIERYIAFILKQAKIDNDMETYDECVVKPMMQMIQKSEE